MSISQAARLERPTSSLKLDGIAVRGARPNDALCLAVLAMQVFLDTYATDGIRPALAREVLTTYSEPRFSGAIGDAAARVIVAELHKHLIGFAQVSLGAEHPLAPGRPQSELLRLYVQEPFTSQGVGTRLLAAAERAAAGQGSAVLWLTPWVHNERAIAFYSRRGYVDYGLTYFRFDGECHENRLLAKSVSSA